MTQIWIALLYLTLAGAVLHLAWRLALAALLWSASAAGGIVIGWAIVSVSGRIGLGVVAAIVVAAFVREIILRLCWRCFYPPNTMRGAR